jgi:DNA-binding MarR family transcriptional regulator
MAKKHLIPEPIPKSVHPLFRDRLCYSISKSGVLFRTMLEFSLAEYGLVPPQAGIMYILNGYGEYNQNLLGQEMSIDKASMVKFIDGLEKKGLVKRTTDPTDRRAKLLTLTPKGKISLKKISGLHQDLEKTILKDFSQKEIEILRDLMPRVLESVIYHLNQKR